MNANAQWHDALAARIGLAFTRFFAALDAPAPILEHRSSIDRWSAHEVAEHVGLTNHFLLILLGKLAEKCRARRTRGVPIPRGAPDLDSLEAISTREFAWIAPEHMRPTGRTALVEVLVELAGQRDRILGFVREFPCGEGRLHTIRMSVIGPEARVDLYQLACFIALHLERHERQVMRALDEARAALGR